MRRRRGIVWSVAGASSLAVVSSCSPGTVVDIVEIDPPREDTVVADPGDRELEIPAPGDWVDWGEILARGGEGEWDRHLAGGFAASAVMRGNVMYLYYQGAEGYDDAEETVTFRAIGVATSSDGLTFLKHPDNPVVTWLPTGDIEEGAASGGAFLTSEGGVGLYYGANTHTSGQLVAADGRYAESSDGFVFEDRGVALDASAVGLWGGGDEVFPIIGLRHDDRWIAYYIPNGVPEGGRLGVAYGSGPTSLGESSPVESGGDEVSAWGPGAAVRVRDDRYALFLTVAGDAHTAGRHVDAYLMDPSDPATLSELVTSYEFENLSVGTVLLDETSESWYLIYRNADASAYRIRTAPVLSVSSSPVTPLPGPRVPGVGGS